MPASGCPCGGYSGGPAGAVGPTGPGPACGQLGGPFLGAAASGLGAGACQMACAGGGGAGCGGCGCFGGCTGTGGCGSWVPPPVATRTVENPACGSSAMPHMAGQLAPPCEGASLQALARPPDLFGAFDRNHDGTISRSEFEQALMASTMNANAQAPQISGAGHCGIFGAMPGAFDAPLGAPGSHLACPGMGCPAGGPGPGPGPGFAPGGLSAPGPLFAGAPAQPGMLDHSGFGSPWPGSPGLMELHQHQPGMGAWPGAF
eukprot:TRINITY_DN17559_c0_g2_i1.p2 TRINITY_DN17559_c0_g2~~TRINITY_DN17559_c0_g2_i1.p2  ORF type:complete len:260 (-),score=29.74 TRINITY_DN17559_c0_g2_i1:74-853(-)